MIAEIRFKNMFSFRDEAILSFEADRSKDMESYHVVELGGDVRLLKVAVIYGANASGKSNIIKVCDFIKSFITYTPLNKAEQIQIVPFLLNKTSSRQLSEYSISFYLKNEEKAVRYVYSVALDRWHVAKESLIYYPSQQPATLFERNTENNVSVIRFGQKIKMSQAVKEEITLKCLHNMSVFAAYMQVNTHIVELEAVLQYLTNQVMPAVVPASSLSRYAEKSIKNESAKDYILRYLQEADFNISNITSKKNRKHIRVRLIILCISIRFHLMMVTMIIMNSRNCLNRTVLSVRLAWLLKYKRFLKMMLFLLLTISNFLFIRN